MRSTASAMYVLQYGAERVSKALSLRGGSAQLYWEPLIGVLVQTTEGWVLLDTGMSRPALDSAEVVGAYGAPAEPGTAEGERWHLLPSPPAGRTWTWGLDDDPLVTALATVDLTVSDISLAAISHLHWDHSGGIPTLAEAGVPVALQQEELDFARSGRVGMAEGFFGPDWSAAATRWELLRGDVELAPGVHALSTPGHTPGHMSFRVDLPGTGSWIFTADATDLAQNLLDRVPCGSCAGGTARDETLAEQSLERLLDEARSVRGRLIPGHDQIVFDAVRHPPGGHR